MPAAIPTGWKKVLASELRQPYWDKLQAFVAQERAEHTVYPPEGETYTALKLTPFEAVRVVILGQDPYPGAGQAHGLAFSVRPGVPTPRSLINIFKELKADLGCQVPNNGYLAPWASQGVLLLNAVLTVRAGAPNSHQGKGWERFTDAVLRAVAGRDRPAVFVLWGGYARKKAALIDGKRHTLVQAAHPSPLSARHGFFGSRPFSQINAALRAAGEEEIDWQLPDL